MLPPMMRVDRARLCCVPIATPTLDPTIFDNITTVDV